MKRRKSQQKAFGAAVVKKACFWYNSGMMRFGKEKKDMARRLRTVFAAVFMWLSVCTAPFTGIASAQSFPAANSSAADSSAAGVFAISGSGYDSTSFDVPIRVDAADVSRAVPQETSPFVSGQVIANHAKQQTPASAGDTKGSRVLASGNPTGGNEKTTGPKLSAFMANAGLAHLLSNHTSAVFFSDKESEVCSLFIIQYLHAQDGLKG